jgi:hypothetical protein
LNSMLATRRVQREWLDELPQFDPRAIRSRRDLARVNTIMLQPRIMARALLAHYPCEAPRTILDLGAGDGTFMLRVAKHLAPRWQDVTVILLDQQNIVSAATRRAFHALEWSAKTITADLFDSLKGGRLPEIDIITANLFLHHFTQDRLPQLFASVATLTPLFVACEPRRIALALLASRLLWVIGCNDVTNHDAAVSVEAGFRGAELSAVWPEPAQWDLHERRAGLFTHSFVARNRGNVT